MLGDSLVLILTSAKHASSWKSRKGRLAEKEKRRRGKRQDTKTRRCRDTKETEDTKITTWLGFGFILRASRKGTLENRLRLEKLPRW